jgi:hypothetical protein
VEDVSGEEEMSLLAHSETSLSTNNDVLAELEVLSSAQRRTRARVSNFIDDGSGVTDTGDEGERTGPLCQFVLLPCALGTFGKRIIRLL